MLPKDLDYYGTLLKKLAPPLVTLLSAEPELQYVALRNINLIVQRRWAWGEGLFATSLINCHISVRLLFFLLCKQAMFNVSLQPRDPEARNEGFLCQVQWPHLRQTGEAGHYDSPSISSQYCSGKKPTSIMQHYLRMLPRINLFNRIQWVTHICPAVGAGRVEGICHWGGCGLCA